MTMRDALKNVRYVIDADGNRTEAIIPISAWKTFLALWQQANELAEDKEDASILRAWLDRRAAGDVETISLDDLEKELASDGLLPG